VAYAYTDGQYWDSTIYNFPFEPDEIEVALYYQSTSKEYIEFLRDENVTNNAGIIMYNLWNNNGKCPPELMATTSWSGVTRWTGNVSSFWGDAGNWDNNLPTSSKNAVIPGTPINQPVINTSSVCNNLVVEDDAIVTITNNSTLTVHGKVLIKGNLDNAGAIHNTKNILHEKD
jgi:hypothetical protein